MSSYWLRKAPSRKSKKKTMKQRRWSSLPPDNGDEEKVPRTHESQSRSGKGEDYAVQQYSDELQEMSRIVEDMKRIALKGIEA